YPLRPAVLSYLPVPKSAAATFAALWRVMLFISTSTPMVWFFISAICFAVFSFILKSSVLVWCVFPFGVNIYALEVYNSKVIYYNILHTFDGWILCSLQPFSSIRNWRERAVFSFIKYSESQPESRPQPINKILLSGHARNGGLQANHLIKYFGRLMIQHGSEFFFFIGQTGSGFSILRITIKLLFIRINVPIEEVLQNVIRHGGHPPFSQCPPHRPRSGRCRCPSA